MTEASGCSHAPRCPACPFIARPYAEALWAKGEQVRRAIATHLSLGGTECAPVVGAEPTRGYRLRAKLVCDAQGSLGLFEAGAHRVVDTPNCPVLSAPLGEAASAVRSLLPLELALAGVDLRVCDDGVLVCLILDQPHFPEEAALRRIELALAARLPSLVGLAFSVRPEGAVQLLGKELRVQRGPAVAPHHLSPSGPFHYAAHGAFTQVHAGQATRLHDRILSLLAARGGGLAGLKVLDLFAGSGAFALRLAAAGAEVTAVDTFGPGLERLGAAAAAQGLVVRSAVADAEAFALAALGHGETPNVVLVNPPRRGLTPALREALVRLGASALIYVSCEPRTLCRDLAHLRALGYSSAAIEAFDMIPQSLAVECLTMLEAAPPPPPRILHEDEDSVFVDKLPFEPTTPQGEHDGSLLERLRAALAEPDLTPVHRLDRGTSGVCWFARNPGKVAPLAQALSAGQKTYLGLCLGVARDKGRVARPLVMGGRSQSATTNYRRQRVVGGHSLLEVQPEQGRKHQIRRHLAAIGHPLLGDTRYGKPSANQHFEHRHGLDRPFLHCAELRVAPHGVPLCVRSELPGDLVAVLSSLAPNEVD